MEPTITQIALHGVSYLLTAIVFWNVKCAREDFKEAVRDIQDVKASVAVNTGNISRVAQMTEYQQRGTDARLGAVSARASDLSGDLDKLTRTIELCPNCPQPGRKP